MPCGLWAGYGIAFDRGVAPARERVRNRNGFEVGAIPLVAEEGWVRQRANAAKPPKRRRRARSASAIARSRNSGQFGPNGFAGLTTPSAPIIRRLRDILLRSRPPLLCEEGNTSP